MPDQMESPYVCHIFVCTNDRNGERRSCADHNSPLLKKALKEEVGNRGWKNQVRVSVWAIKKRLVGPYLSY